MKKIYILFISLSIVTLFQDLKAQIQKNGIPEIEYYNRRVYDGATQNWDISQGNTGFLYFANNNGVVEFDGEQWKLYDDVGSYIIRSVKSIGDRVYVGSYNELGYFKYDSLSNFKYHSLAKGPEFQNLEDFWSIHEWNQHVVFHSKKGICLFKNDELIKIIPSSSQFISAFVVNGMLLIQDESLGLMEVRGSEIYPIAGGAVFADEEISSIVSLSSSEIVISTMKHGLYLWNMYEIKEWNVAASELLKTVNVFCGINYKNTYLIFGTIQGGIVITNMQGEVFMQIDKDKGLKNNTVLSVFKDSEGNIWCGLDNGIARINFNSGVSFLQGYFDLGTGYVVNKYKGNYFFGTNQALFSISEDEFNDPLKTKDNFKRISGTEGQVWSLFSDDNSLLCGHNLGVFDISSSKVKCLTPHEVNGVWNFREIKGNPNLLISGTYNGLVLFEKNNGRWKFKKKIKGFKESSRFIEFDDEGYVWISHGYIGVYKIKLSDDFQSVASIDTFDYSYFPGSEGGVVLSKINGNCIISGLGGIYSFNENKTGFNRLENYDNFFEEGNFPLRIIEDQFKNLWCIVNTGVSVLRYLEDGSYKKIEFPFLPLDRKLVNGFENLFVENERNVFFGVEDGFAHYSAQSIKDFKIPFKVHIRSFKGNEVEHNYQLNNVGGRLVQYVIPEFKFRKNAFQINYSASFFETEKIQYSTFLNGYDSKPGEWESTAFRNLANLHEGHYEFEVTAKNAYGVITEPVSFKFSINPPWYRSVVAKVIYILISICIVLLAILIINRRMELSRENEKIKQRERFKEIEEHLQNAALLSEKEMIRMRNEKLRSEMIFKEKELANSTINLIQKNNLLSDIKLQLKKIVKIPDRKESERKIAILIKKIDKDIDNENNWEVFEMHFGQVHEEFLKKLKERHPDLSIREQKLSAYIKMGMSSKEIASLMNITTRAVENNRYKLRQKLGVQQGENLSSYISKI